MPDENDDDQNQNDDTSGEGGQDQTDHKAEAEKWKALSRKHEREAKDRAKELDQIRQGSLSEAEKAAEAARQEGRQAALLEVSDRMLRSEVRAAALDKLADPEDAYPLLKGADLLEGLVDKDGEVDSKAVAAAVDRLVKAKPHLAKSGSRPGKLRAGSEQPSSKTSMNDAIRGALGL